MTSHQDCNLVPGDGSPVGDWLALVDAPKEEIYTMAGWASMFSKESKYFIIRVFATRPYVSMRDCSDRSGGD